ncbi:nSTAND1 domain-containing NTPase [Streptomyces sp. 4N509B]|uniref:nSTAND1 domain-containing NTPase n=1 Tax=Streptomyces sp. 4N509B TaxID=3457413 RepID=UPI003FD54230
MGRQERPLDPGGGPVPALARELRELRRSSGLTYREMARRTRFTASTFSRAAGGEHLPSLAVTLAYVEACGGDVAAWRRRWQGVSRELADAALADAVPAQDEGGESGDGAATAPYQGLARFEPGDAGRFFGRAELVDRLVAMVCEHRFSIVFGASGSGKSSLLRAGLIPALRRPGGVPGPGAAVVRILTPGAHPVRTHRAAVTGTAGDGTADAGGADAGERERNAARGDTAVIVDQFEELYTLCRDPAERAAFVDLLLAANEPASRLRVVIAVRADFYGRLADHPGLAAAADRASVLVGPMSQAELREAIVMPARAAGLVVERELTARIVEDVAGRPAALPLMSHALLATWRQRRGRTLTARGYEAVGGVSGAVARTAEDTHTRLTPRQAELARRVLLRLVALGDGAPDTRRPAERSGLAFADADADDVDTVLERLARARLITLDGTTVDLAHEALITAWPRLRDWIDADRERLWVRQRLAADARSWEELERDPGALYRGSRLATAAETFPAGDRADLTRRERAFLTASLDARERERRAAARTARRLRGLAVTLALLLVLTAAATVVAVRQQQAADAARERAVAAEEVALSRQLAAQSATWLASDPDLASLLAVAAYRTSHTAEAASGLHQAAALPLRRRLAGKGSAVESVAFSPDGATLAVGFGDGAVWLVDAATGRHTVLRAAGVEDWVDELEFSPDGATLVTLTASDGLVEAWNVRSGRSRTLFATPRLVTSLAFSPDGSTLALGSSDGPVRLVDAATGEPSGDLTGHATSVVDLVFGPGGRMLASVATDGELRLWDRDAATDDARHVLAPRDGEGDGDVTSIAFSPDGTTVATGVADGTARLVDAGSGAALHTVRVSPGGGVAAVGFSSDGDTLATAGEDGVVRLWDVAPGEAPRRTLPGEGPGEAPGEAPELSRTLPGHGAPVTGLAFGSDGTTLATGDADGVVRLWDTGAGLPRRLLTGGTADGDTSGDATGGDPTDADTNGDLTDGASGAVGGPGGQGSATVVLAFSHDGTTLAAGDENGTVRVWTTAGEPRRELVLDRVTSLAFAPDGATLAVGGLEGEVELWDLDTGRLRERLRHHSGWIDALAFTPDGTRLVSANNSDGTVRVFDTATGGAVRTVEVGWTTALAVSPDGATLAVSGVEGRVRLWGLAAGRAEEPGREKREDDGRGPGRTLDADGWVDALAFGPDGSTLTALLGDGSVRLWDVATGTVAHDLASRHHTAASVAFGAAGEVLVTGGTDGSVQLWDVATLTHRDSRVGHAAPVTSVVVTPDGATLASGSADGAVMLWDLALPSPAEAIGHVCSVVGRDLTARERERYLPGRADLPVCP